MRAVGFGLFSLFGLFFFGIAIGATIFWIITVLEVARLPEPWFRAGGTDKQTWVLVVALTGVIGALVWRFSKREEVLAAGPYAAQLPPPPLIAGPPAGWVPESPGGPLRWWDGVRWTEHRPPPTV